MRQNLPIFQTCLTILFLELLLIRWISTEINIFAYLQNSVLIACFLGLGVGLIEPRPADRPLRLMLPLLALTAFLGLPVTQRFARDASQVLGSFHDFQVWDEVGSVPAWALVLALCIVMLVLGCCWAIMVQLGAELARRLDQAPNRIQAYSADMLGSLAGVWLFSLMSFFSLPPMAWFLVLAALLLSWPAFRNRWGMAACLGMLIIAGIDAAAGVALRTTWTPYQKLATRLHPVDQEWVVLVNNVAFQQIQDNRAENRLPILERPIHQYNLPARLAGQPRTALILGAGTGNDVAGMLRNSSANITAVDIDPVLMKFGRQLNPEQPYADSRVRPVVNDARATLQSLPPGSQDVIVFGLLDSHTTPNLSNARLDNFVYTRESMQAARRLLRPEGVMVIFFQAQRNYIGSRLHNCLAEVFQQEPLVFSVPYNQYGCGGMGFVLGSPKTIAQSLQRDPALKDFIEKNSLQGADPRVLPTTDAWPYLYIEKPSTPSLFWVLGLAFAALWALSSFLRYGRVLGPDLTNGEEVYMLLLGAGFSLVQVFSICKAAILFGSTWIVNSVAISGILVMILAANLLLPHVRLSRGLVTLLLGASCLVLAFFPLSQLLLLPPALRLLAAGLLSGLPMLASGILFGRAFAASRRPGRALGANLFGAMLGGGLQLLTFRWGIPSLMVVAGAFYLASGLVRITRPSPP